MLGNGKGQFLFPAQQCCLGGCAVPSVLGVGVAGITLQELKSTNPSLVMCCSLLIIMVVV